MSLHGPLSQKVSKFHLTMKQHSNQQWSTLLLVSKGPPTPTALAKQMSPVLLFPNLEEIMDQVFGHQEFMLNFENIQIFSANSFCPIRRQGVFPGNSFSL